jgi:hypothetical protein
MPKSKVRKKAAYTPPPADKRSPEALRAASPSSPLYLGVMLGLMLLGLVWLVVNYLAGDKIGFMAALGSWNFAIGFVLIVTGLLMTMRWR